jgi:phosphoenolpyruvate-protein kinase (PTS system EI component)
MTPGALAVARRVVRETNARAMTELAARVLTLGTVDEIEALLRETFDRPTTEAPAR